MKRRFEKIVRWVVKMIYKIYFGNKMKTLFFLLISIAAFAQQPDVAGDVLHHGVPLIPVQPALGKSYMFLYLKGTAILPETIPDSTWVVIRFNKPAADTTKVPVTQIDTVDSEALTYSDWPRHGTPAPAGWYANTISYSTTGTASYTFTGTKISVYSETKETHGVGEIRIDDVGTEVKWNEAPYGLDKKVFEKTLQPGSHTIVIKPVSGVVLIDYLVVEE